MRRISTRTTFTLVLALAAALMLGVLPALAAPTTKDAATDSNSYLYGESAYEVAAFASSASGDVNGDGIADLVMGHDAGGGAGKGRVYVYYGRTSLPSGVDLGSGADVVITGYDMSCSGCAVACGNVNGDGYADILIGAWYDSPGGATQAGGVAVIFGSASLPRTWDFNSTAPNLYISNKIAGEYSGMSVTCGDIDGDGYGDIIFGAPLGNGGVQFGSGSGWAPQGGANADTLKDVSMLSATDGWAVGQYLSSYDTIYRFNGTSWENDVWLEAFKVNLNGVSAFDSTHVWAVGDGGTIAFFSGTSWAKQTSGITARLNDVEAVSATTAWAVGDGGVIIKTTDGGATWTSQSSTTNRNLKGISAVDANTVYAAGDNGTILRTTNGGATWAAEFAWWSSVNLRGISAVSDTSAWAVGEDGTIYTRASLFGWMNWTGQTSGVSTHLNAVSAVDASTVFAAGDGGVVLKTTNGGSRWTRQTVPFNYALFGVDAVDATNAWAVGEAASGRVYVSWGRASGWPAWTRTSPIVPNLVINGVDPWDYCGVPVSTGRLNNDSRSDLVIGASEAGGPGNGRAGCGEAYVVLGRTKANFGSAFALPGSNSTTIYGGTAGDGFPSSLCNPLKNVNGDSYDDVIAGVTYADGPGDARPNCGELDVIYGRRTWPASIDLATTAPSIMVYGGDAGASIGFCVDALDFNGDGRLDLVASSPSAGYAGRARCGVVWVKYGPATWPAQVDLGAGGSNADVLLYGAEKNDAFGFCVAAGNFNNAGPADILIGNVNGAGPDNVRPHCGEYFVFLGSPLSSLKETARREK